MSNKITSKSPFKGRPNRRAGAGPIYNTFTPQPMVSSGKTTKKNNLKSPCFGPYDNLTNYVWVVDLSNGNNLAYVDCDYV
jgi:hypothetical protein